MKYSLIKGTYLIEGEVQIGYGIGYTENSALSFECINNMKCTALRKNRGACS